MVCPITQGDHNKGHYAVQSHSRSSILVPIQSSYTISCQRLILTYLLSCTVSEIKPSIGPKSLYLATPLAFNPPRRRGSPETISVKFSVDVNGWASYQMAQKHCRKFQPAEQGARATDDRQTCMNVSSRSLKKTRPNFTKFSAHVNCGRGSVLL